MNSEVQAYAPISRSETVIDIEQYAYLVKRIAYHMMAKMPASVQVDDLIQAGTIGLIEAASKFEATKGASFETYAGIRIRGAIVDEVRRGDWAPRSVHRNSRMISQAMSELEHTLGRHPTDHEISEHLELSVEDYCRMIADGASTRLFSLDTPSQNDDESGTLVDHIENEEDTPNDLVFKEALVNDLVASINTLPERERLVMSLYYEQELNLKEIGLVLDVSESRVSQILSQATHRLRSKMASWNS